MIRNNNTQSGGEPFRKVKTPFSDKCPENTYLKKINTSSGGIFIGEGGYTGLTSIQGVCSNGKLLQKMGINRKYVIPGHIDCNGEPINNITAKSTRYGSVGDDGNIIMGIETCGKEVTATGERGRTVRLDDKMISCPNGQVAIGMKGSSNGEGIESLNLICANKPVANKPVANECDLIGNKYENGHKEIKCGSYPKHGSTDGFLIIKGNNAIVINKNNDVYTKNYKETNAWVHKGIRKKFNKAFILGDKNNFTGDDKCMLKGNQISCKRFNKGASLGGSTDGVLFIKQSTGELCVINKDGSEWCRRKNAYWQKTNTHELPIRLNAI